MPKRTNEKQEVVALLRQALAREGCTITESKMLQVDVVMECSIDDVPMTISFEVVARKRKADIPWVEQMLKKHEGLATDKLVLVSWSGFAETAERRARIEPNVLLVKPKTEGMAESPRLKTFYVDSVNLGTRKVDLIMSSEGQESIRVDAQPNTLLFSADGTEIGTVGKLAAEILDEPPVGQRVLREAHNHPERQDIKRFVIGLSLPPDSLHLRKNEDGTLHPVSAVEVSGNISWTQQALNLEVAKFGDILFGHGQSEVWGRPALFVTTINDKNMLDNVAMRVYPPGVIN